MIRGVSFKISPALNDTILWKILKCIDVQKYTWYNIGGQSEVWADSQGTDFFKRNYYDGKSFINQIQSKHYIVFLKLQAYFVSGTFFDILTYEEFVASDCQILFLINDCQFVEIYSKSKNNSETLYRNAVINHFTNIEYITDSNDERIKMNIL